MHEQSATAGAAAMHRHSNDMVWRVHLRERGEEDAVAPTVRTDRTASPPGDDGAEPEASGPWLYLVVMLEFQSTVDYLMRAPELRDLKKFMLAWAGWRARQAGLTIEAEDMAEVNQMENPDDVEAFYMTRAQVWEEERRAEGRVMGQRESMRRHAAMKFDAETAARLGAMLEDVTDQEVFDGVLAALLECDTPSELFERATEARRRANGRNPPADCRTPTPHHR